MVKTPERWKDTEQEHEVLQVEGTRSLRMS